MKDIKKPIVFVAPSIRNVLSVIIDVMNQCNKQGVHESWHFISVADNLIQFIENQILEHNKNVVGLSFFNSIEVWLQKMCQIFCESSDDFRLNIFDRKKTIFWEIFFLSKSIIEQNFKKSDINFVENKAFRISKKFYKFFNDQYVYEFERFALQDEEYFDQIFNSMNTINNEIQNNIKNMLSDTINVKYFDNKKNIVFITNVFSKIEEIEFLINISNCSFISDVYIILHTPRSIALNEEYSEKSQDYLNISKSIGSLFEDIENVIIDFYNQDKISLYNSYVLDACDEKSLLSLFKKTTFFRSSEKVAYDDLNKDIEVHEHASIQSEVESAKNIICEHIKNHNIKQKDIVIVTPNTKIYRNILETWINSEVTAPIFPSDFDSLFYEIKSVLMLIFSVIKKSKIEHNELLQIIESSLFENMFEKEHLRDSETWISMIKDTQPKLETNIQNWKMLVSDSMCELLMHYNETNFFQPIVYVLNFFENSMQFHKENKTIYDWNLTIQGILKEIFTKINDDSIADIFMHIASEISVNLNVKKSDKDILFVTLIDFILLKIQQILPKNKHRERIFFVDLANNNVPPSKLLIALGIQDKYMPLFKENLFSDKFNSNNLKSKNCFANLLLGIMSSDKCIISYKSHGGDSASCFIRMLEQSIHSCINPLINIRRVFPPDLINHSNNNIKFKRIFLAKRKKLNKFVKNIEKEKYSICHINDILNNILKKKSSTILFDFYETIYLPKNKRQMWKQNIKNKYHILFNEVVNICEDNNEQLISGHFQVKLCFNKGVLNIKHDLINNRIFFPPIKINNQIEVIGDIYCLYTKDENSGSICIKPFFLFTEIDVLSDYRKKNVYTYIKLCIDLINMLDIDICRKNNIYIDKDIVALKILNKSKQNIGLKRMSIQDIFNDDFKILKIYEDISNVFESMK